MGLLTQTHLPVMTNEYPRLSRQARIRWSGEAEKDPKSGDFRYETVLTHHLTGQGRCWCKSEKQE